MNPEEYQWWDPSQWPDGEIPPIPAPPPALVSVETPNSGSIENL